MKFCSNCGKEVYDDAIICMSCGCSLQKKALTNEKDMENVGLNILAFFIPIVGFILYFCWKSESPKKANGVGKWALISFVAGIVLEVFLYEILISALLY